MFYFRFYTTSAKTAVERCRIAWECCHSALYWSMAAVGLHIPTVNGAVSSAKFSTSNGRRRREWLVSSNLSGRVADQSNDHTSLLRNQ